MNNSDIECPQCGAVVYYELDRCPECGFEFYPIDDDREEEAEPSRANEWGRSLVSILIGWLASFTIFILFAIGRAGFHEATDWQAQSLLVVTATAFVGGYVASVIARRRPILHGALVAILCVPNAVLLEMLWRDVAQEPLLRPLTLLVWGLVVASGVVGAATYSLLKGRQTARLADIEDNLYDDLLVKVRHDEAVADRLIDLERQRAPAASEIELIKNAIARWERDNR